MEGFEGLSSAFNLDNDEEFNKIIQSVDKDIKTIETKKNEIAVKTAAPLVFQDQEFIRTEIRSLIMSARTVMYKVEQDIKIGTDNRKIEVYAKLLESIGKQYTSLIELNKHIFDAQIQSGQIAGGNKNNDNKISLTPEQVMEMLERANKSSQMGAIDANFVIEDEYLPGMKTKKGDDD